MINVLVLFYLALTLKAMMLRYRNGKHTLNVFVVILWCCLFGLWLISPALQHLLVFLLVATGTIVPVSKILLSDGVGGRVGLNFSRFSDTTTSLNVQSANLALIKEQDPNFSMPVFREFAVLLYSQALQEMPKGSFVHSRPFLSDQTMALLTRRAQSFEAVEDVVVGTFKIGQARVQGKNLMLKVEIESNYLVQLHGASKAFVVLETWTFQRGKDVLTKPPKPLSHLTCPNCGYGGDFPANGICPQCQQTNVSGRFDWVVTGVLVRNSQEVLPHQAEGGGVEAGTRLQTRVQSDLGRKREELLTRYPEFSFDAFWEKATAIFMKLQDAWSKRDPSQCRPHETDVLFRMHRYWIDNYRREGRINQLADIKVEKWELSKIEFDAFYESITARVYASMTDATFDEKGVLLYGDPKRPRKFTEYWTFIRRVGGKKAKGDSIHTCPSCGAPLDRINQSGECDYCQTVITLGDFDWVLSNIEQDEVYSL